jgi:hypothetical protein
MPCCEIEAKIHEYKRIITVKMIKLLKEQSRNRNKNYNQKNRTANKNIEILYNKVKIIKHIHLTNNKINSLVWW